MEHTVHPSWRSKLVPNSTAMLRGLVAQFPLIAEIATATFTEEQIDEWNLRDLDWSIYYRTLDGSSTEETQQIAQEPDLLLEAFKARQDAWQEGYREEIVLPEIAYRFGLLAKIKGYASPVELLRQVREGDDDALFRLVRLDKSILTHKWVEDRLRRAQLSGDDGFFQKLGNAVRYNPRAKADLDLLNLLLTAIANLAREHVTIPEACDILEHVCDYRVDNEERIRKRWDRLGLRKINPLKSHSAERKRRKGEATRENSLKNKLRGHLLYDERVGTLSITFASGKGELRETSQPGFAVSVDSEGRVTGITIYELNGLASPAGVEFEILATESESR